MKKENKMNNKGFSLVELIVVIAIMAILVGALAPQFIKYVEKSRQASDMQSVNEMKSAVEVYAADKEEGLTNMSISVSGTAISVDGAAASNAGIASNITPKSSGWGTGTFTYNADTYMWGASNCSNTKAPNYDMITIFQ